MEDPSISGNCIFIKPHTRLTPPPTDNQELIRIGLNSEEVKVFADLSELKTKYSSKEHDR